MSTGTSAASAGILGKALSLAGLASVAVIGALLMVAVSPPKDKKTMFLMAVAAGVTSLVFGGPAVNILDHLADWVDLHEAAPEVYFEWAAPVYFVIGAVGWGACGALVKLRDLIRDNGAGKVAEKLGIGDKS
jgi:hypothetical protein